MLIEKKHCESLESQAALSRLFTAHFTNIIYTKGGEA